jgi:hypothetical protein
VIGIGQQSVAVDSSRRFMNDPLVVLNDVEAQGLALNRVFGQTGDHNHLYAVRVRIGDDVPGAALVDQICISVA